MKEDAKQLGSWNALKQRAEAAEKALAAIVLERSQAMKELAEHYDEATAERDDLRWQTNLKTSSTR